MIKAIAFDFGNVICNFDINIFLKKISGHTDKSADELYDLIYGSDLPMKYETGLISSEEFFNQIVNMCNFSISMQDFIEAFTCFFIPIRTSFDLIKKLKAKYKIALLSNTNEWHFEHVIKRVEIFDLFDAVSLSFKVKEMKPGKKIYFDMLSKLNLEPGECVHIDDIKLNVDAACAVGINGVQYVSHNELIESLNKLNVRV